LRPKAALRSLHCKGALSCFLGKHFHAAVFITLFSLRPYIFFVSFMSFVVKIFGCGQRPRCVLCDFSLAKEESGPARSACKAAFEIA
jgi:hypothetical protein